MADLTRVDATELHRRFTEGEAGAGEIVIAHLERMKEVEPVIRAFLATMADEALAQAAALDAARARGEDAGPMAGVPVAIKDIISVSGVPTTCGSRILRDYVPPFEATCVERLRGAGGIIMGKTNMDEFAMGSSTEHSAYGPTRNPWDPRRVAGGSSGGSAAAVASGEVPAALGTDTGGSIRQPAAFTGTVGLKPTYGRVSRFGLVAFASSLDQAGCLTRSVRDAARLLSVIAGRDPRDMTSAPDPVDDYHVALQRRDLSGMKVGVPDQAFDDGLAPEIMERVQRCVALLDEAGAECRAVSIPSMSAAIATYYVIATAEASSNLARYDGVRYGTREPGSGTLRQMYEETRRAGFGPEVKRRIMLGTYVLSAGYYDAYYLKAMKVRSLIRNEFVGALRSVDILLMPTTPAPAFLAGEKTEDPLAMYLADIYTVTANLAGLPAISVPCGFTPDGLPVGCQLIARHFEESTLLSAAAGLERALAGEAGPEFPPLASADGA